MVHARPGDELPHLVLALAAEGAVEDLAVVTALVFFAHKVGAFLGLFPRSVPDISSR